jgi:hypothetical protein
MNSHPREQRPKHTYTLEEFGFTAEEIRRRFRAYRERHIEKPAQSDESSCVQ